MTDAPTGSTSHPAHDAVGPRAPIATLALDVLGGVGALGGLGESRAVLWATRGSADAYDATLDGVTLVDASAGAVPALRVDGRGPGRRGWVRDVRRDDDGGGSFAAATGDGFSRVLGARVLHRRVLALVPGPALACLDEWTGRGRRRVDLRWSLGPGLSAVASGDAAIVTAADGRTFRLTAPGLTLAVSAGAIAGGADVGLPARVVHAWTSGDAPATVSVRPVPGAELRVEVVCGSRAGALHVPAWGTP